MYKQWNDGIKECYPYNRITKELDLKLRGNTFYFCNPSDLDIERSVLWLCRELYLEPDLVMLLKDPVGYFIEIVSNHKITRSLIRSKYSDTYTGSAKLCFVNLALQKHDVIELTNRDGITFTNYMGAYMKYIENFDYDPCICSTVRNFIKENIGDYVYSIGGNVITVTEKLFKTKRYKNLRLKVSSNNPKMFKYMELVAGEFVSDNRHSPDKEVPKRKQIPKKIRRAIWEKYNGNVLIGKCKSCKNNLDYDAWHCSHIKAHQKGGEMSLDNLIPCCSTCNQDMGTEDADDYVNRCEVYLGLLS